LSDLVWWSLGSSDLECPRLDRIKLTILRAISKQVACQVPGHPEVRI
jgi:hypothetical protein